MIISSTAGRQWKTRTQTGECVEAKAFVPARTYAFPLLGFCVWGQRSGRGVESWAWMGSPQETPASAITPALRAAPAYVAGTGRSRHEVVKDKHGDEGMQPREGDKPQLVGGRPATLGLAIAKGIT
jgi:hypothetical protein